MKLRLFALTLALLTMMATATLAQDGASPNIDCSRPATAEQRADVRRTAWCEALTRELYYSPELVCLAMVKLFVLPHTEDFGEFLKSMHGKCESPDGSLVVFEESDWRIRVNRIATLDREGYSEIEVEIIGPAAELTKNAPSGYELITLRILSFFDGKLEFTVFPYYRRSVFNRRSIEELSAERHRDNVTFDPTEGWNELRTRIVAAVVGLGNYIVQNPQ